MYNSKRVGISLEGKRISELHPQANQLFFKPGSPRGSFLKRGSNLNYSNIYGWVEENYSGGENISGSDDFGTSHTVRLPGIPGSRT